MRKILLALPVVFGLSACDKTFNQHFPGTNVEPPFPPGLKEDIQALLPDAQYKMELQGDFSGSPEGFIRITGIDCGAAVSLLQNPQIEISEDLRSFVKALIANGNAEINERPRIIGTCSNDSFDPDALDL